MKKRRKKIGFERTKDGFRYYGELVDALVFAQKQYDRLNKKSARLLQRYTVADAAMMEHEKALRCAADFIHLAAEELARQTSETWVSPFVDAIAVDGVEVHIDVDQ